MLSIPIAILFGKYRKNSTYLAFGEHDGDILKWEDDNWRARMVRLFWIYRCVTFYIYMIMISIFALVSFEANKVEEFDRRNNITMETNLGLLMFIYAWITGPLWHCIGWFVFKNGVREKSVVRDVGILAQNRQWNDISELIEFGISIRQKVCCYLIVHCVYIICMIL